MLCSRSLLVGSGVLAALSAVACNSDSLTTPGTTTLQITTSTSGTELDADGYTVQVDGGAGQAIGASASIQRTDLSPGNHTVQLAGVAANCGVSGDNPRTVTVAAGQTATVSFAVTCGAMSGTIKVTTVTTGSSVDPDGYTVSVDAGTPQTIGVNASLTLTSIPAGSHSVTLGGLASGCTVQDANPRTVTVAVGVEASVSFTVTCGSSAVTHWTTIRLPPDRVATALWASSPSDLFVVARSRSAPSTAPNYVLHYDGHGWTEQFHGGDWYTSPNVLWGSSPTDVFAAGNTMIWHYDGTQWVATARELELYGSIWGSSPNDVFAGGVADHSPEVPLVLHYDGTQWSDKSPPFNPGTVYDIAGSSATDVWAVGEQFAPPDAPPESNYSTSEIVRYDGNAWTNSLEIPLRGGPNDIAMNGVWANAPNDVFLVGFSGRILHYDGTSWSPMTSATSQNLWDIWGNSSSNVYAVGVGGILHYDGKTWTVIRNTDTSRVWGVGTDVFVISGGEVVHGTP